MKQTEESTKKLEYICKTKQTCLYLEVQLFTCQDDGRGRSRGRTVTTGARSNDRVGIEKFLLDEQEIYKN